MDDGSTAPDAHDSRPATGLGEHLVQIYAHDGTLLDALERFVAGGIGAGESVVVIATPEHLAPLRERIRGRGIDLIAAENEDRYIALTAPEALSEFMHGNWPDEMLFRGFIARVLKRARADGRRVRAFGEMVAVLWAQGHRGATVRLEQMWDEVCREQDFTVFCAYPESGFTRDTAAALADICAAHSRTIVVPSGDSVRCCA